MPDLPSTPTDPQVLLSQATCYRCIPEGLRCSVLLWLVWLAVKKKQVGHQAETIAYQDAIIDNGGTISETSLNCVDQFIVDCKAANIWTKLWDIGLFMGDQLAAALVKLKDYSGSTPVLLNTGFVNGDYTEATGLVGDGATKYLDTGVITDSVNSLSFYVRSHALGISNPMGEGFFFFGALNGVFIEYGFVGVKAYWGSNAEMTVPVAGGYAAFSLGLVSSVFVSNPEMRIYNNGISIANAGAVGGSVRSVNNRSAFLFAVNDSAGVSGFTPDTMSFYCIGDTLNATESLSFYNAVQALQTCLGREV